MVSGMANEAKQDPDLERRQAQRLARKNRNLALGLGLVALGFYAGIILMYA